MKSRFRWIKDETYNKNLQIVEKMIVTHQKRMERIDIGSRQFLWQNTIKKITFDRNRKAFEKYTVKSTNCEEIMVKTIKKQDKRFTIKKKFRSK